VRDYDSHERIEGLLIMDAVTAGLIGGIIGAAVNSIGTSLNTILMSHLTEARETRSGCTPERKELYRKIFREVDSVNKVAFGSIELLTPRHPLPEQDQHEVNLWAGQRVGQLYRLHTTVLVSNCYFRIRAATPNLSDALVWRMLNLPPNNLQPYNSLLDTIRNQSATEPSVDILDGMLSVLGHEIKASIRHSLKIS
jgi:hypothetical protein